MASMDSEPRKTDRDDRPGSRRRTRGQWILTQEAFDKLLAKLSADREEAGREYEAIRIKLVRYFQSRQIDSAETRADETINRVARRIDEGEQIDNLTGYMYRTAYLVFMEGLKEPAHAEIDLEKAPTANCEPLLEDTEQERRRRCFDNCLNSLTAENRELVLSYYREDRRAKIDLRKQLADRLRIPVNALRIRVHRIRVSLERCIKECLGQPA